MMPKGKGKKERERTLLDILLFSGYGAAILWAHSDAPGVVIMGLALATILLIALRIYTRV